MSAELLRAAKAIRDEWGPTRASAWSTVQNFHLAVADWLDATAVTMRQVEDDLRGLEGAPTVEQVYGYDFNAALVAARAYLGDLS